MDPKAYQSDLTNTSTAETASDGRAAEHEAVLSQWTRALEGRIVPDDQIAELACCEAMMTALAQHGVGITTLSSHEDRCTYSRLARHACEVVSKASPHAKQNLQG